jgi:cellulose synthase/poly-beta-1,6-N-acetylglucosamine synthase-like glycosyltransferase
MEQHPEVGLLGAKVLNPDGTLQISCRRGFPTPAAAFYRMSGLSRLFPKSRRFGKYNLSYLDPDLSCRVDAISGCFMFCRRALFESVHGFDERFFMYGEDLDLCFRINATGAAVWYHPEIRIIHVRGTSSAKRLLPSRIAFYKAMILFSRKYQDTHRSFFPRWLIHAGIIIQATLNIGSKMFRSLTAALVDLIVINVTFAFCLTARFAYKMENPYATATTAVMIGVHAVLSASFLFMFAFSGVYSKQKSTPSAVLLSGFFASILFMACIFFLKFFAFSRIAFGIAALLIVLLLVLWRQVLPAMLRQGQRILYARESVIIVGNGRIPSLMIQNFEKLKTVTIAGILWTGEGEQPGQFEGYPVLGRMEDVAEVLKRFPIDALLIATPLSWYSHIIEALAEVKRKNLAIRWVPRELFTMEAKEVPAVIPLHDFSV